ncbi:MAG: hypothetical protein GC159_15575 [Phycisphaera sp.]|nr:hypothetical protein [Phycisphaera sp.]
MNQLDTTNRRGRDLLAVGFGTTVAMWATLYFCLMPYVGVAGNVVIGLMAVILLGGGFVLGRYAGRTWRGGLGLGSIVWMLNLIITTSLLGGDKPHEVVTGSLKWIAGFAVAAIALATLGTLIGRAMTPTPNPQSRTPNDWHAAFPVVAMCTTLCLITAGGVVTGLQAGLAVPDWPNTFDHPMIFYPLTLMQRDGHVYAEHAHRLWGMLVGLTTIVLMVQIWRTDSRGWLRGLVVAVFVAVCCQGVLGGLRVTEKNTAMAMAHGVFAQVIFATLVAIAVSCTRAWRDAGMDAAENPDAPPHPAASTERKIGGTLMALVFVQLLLGATVRHFTGVVRDHTLLVHILVATVVFVLASVAAMRVIGVHGKTHRPLKRLGVALLLVVLVQVGLGFGAMIVTGISADARPDDTGAILADVVVTTMHQVNGALLLGTVTALTLLGARLLSHAGIPEESAGTGASPNKNSGPAPHPDAAETA